MPGGTAGQAPGERSEKEADAASRDAPIEIVLGRPAAAAGLEIITRRPKHPLFTQLTLVTSRPSNPEFEVHFDRSGRVLDVKVVKSSGIASVDGPLVAAVYGWTARGERLGRIGPGPDATLAVPVTILIWPKSK